MIVPLVKVSAYGFLKDKESVLAGLQEIGCLHLIPLSGEEGTRAEGASSVQSHQALRFLLACRHKRRQVTNPKGFDAATVVMWTLDTQRQIQTLQDERDFLRGRIKDLMPWGNFAFPSSAEVKDFKNLRLWLYVVPHHEMKKVRASNLIWEIVHQDHRLCYVVVLSESEPEGLPTPRTRTGGKSLVELERRMEEVEVELEDLQAERSSLTRWCYLLGQSIYRLEDQAELRAATRKTRDEDPLFAIQAWAPREKVGELQAFADKMQLALDVREPEPGDNPPTLLRNAPLFAGGQDLVSFYMTPSYWLWDPSTIVFFAFAVFFAMILSDAGYALLLGAGLALRWRAMGRSDFGRRFRVLLLAIAVASAAWGALIGSYFGVAPSQGSFLARVKVLELNDFAGMMRLSILMGVMHLILANGVSAWHLRRSAQALAPVGWVAIFVGGVMLWLGGSAWKTPGFTALGLGGIGVLLFSEAEGPIWRRVLGGFHQLTRLSGAFGDSLSYLRLFALGLAGGSLAATFNELAGKLQAWAPGIGILFAILLVVLGHSMNLLLGISSGVIHGLRLNFIEFFNWSIPQEGPAFQAFSRREK